MLATLFNHCFEFFYNFFLQNGILRVLEYIFGGFKHIRLLFLRYDILFYKFI